MTVCGIKQVDLGRCHKPDVDLDLFVAAEPADGAFLQHAEQLHLQSDRHALDLVEQERAALGIFDHADPPLLGIREGSGFVAEEFAVDQAFRQGSAIDGHEPVLAAGAAVVKGARHNFLASTGLAMDQDRSICGADIHDLFAEGLHGRRIADETGREPRRFASSLRSRRLSSTSFRFSSARLTFGRRSSISSGRSMKS